jgi:choline kinase
MKAIILSAGQGRRLLPLTERSPKCLLPVEGEHTVLELQLAALARCGVRRAIVMLGFGAEQVERHLAEHPVRGIQVETRFNPFFASADNLATCWLAARDMDQDFLLVNGDTLFGPDLLQRVLDGPESSIAVTIDRKGSYDADDMKVSLSGRRLLAIGKKLSPAETHGEAIGLIRVRGRGVAELHDALEEAIREPDALGRWYLSVVDRLAKQSRVDTISIEGQWWSEIDSPGDLARVREALDKRLRSRDGRNSLYDAWLGPVREV